MVARGEVTLEMALQDHLCVNHYPPIHVSWLPACKAAVEACLDDDAQREIELPEMDSGSKGTAPAHQVVERLRLGAFVMVQDVAMELQDAP
jgi:hypothetical protein